MFISCSIHIIIHSMKIPFDVGCSNEGRDLFSINLNAQFVWWKPQTSLRQPNFRAVSFWVHISCMRGTQYILKLYNYLYIYIYIYIKLAIYLIHKLDELLLILWLFPFLSCCACQQLQCNHIHMCVFPI